MLTENYRRGTLEKLGLGYDVLADGSIPASSIARSPATAAPGPTPTRAASTSIAQGFAGLMAITGEPGGPPVKTGKPVADINAGILAAVGLPRRVRAQAEDGRGQMVDTSLMEAALQQTYWQAAIYFATGASPGPPGSAHLLTAPYQALPASDGWINIGGANQANWERIVEVLGRAATRRRSALSRQRRAHGESAALVEALTDIFATAGRRRVAGEARARRACRRDRCWTSANARATRKRSRGRWWWTCRTRAMDR